MGRKEAVEADERAAEYRRAAKRAETEGEKSAQSKEVIPAALYRRAANYRGEVKEAYRWEAEALKEVAAAYRRAAAEVETAYREAAEAADKVADALTIEAAAAIEARKKKASSR